MPFSLTNSPAVFLVLVSDVLRDFLNVFVLVYLDDILTFSKTPKEHRVHVPEVLQWLLENHLYIKAEKFEFHSSSVTFLDNILAGGQLKMDPTKILAFTGPLPLLADMHNSSSA